MKDIFTTILLIRRIINSSIHQNRLYNLIPETNIPAPFHQIFLWAHFLCLLFQLIIDEEVYSVDLEVQSVKSGYRDDYRDMLEFITEKCTDLLLQANSPASHYFEIDYSRDSQTLYQRFAFIKSVIGTDEFSEALHRIVTAPVTTWASKAENKDIRQARRFSNANIRELLRTGNRTKLPEQHYLKKYGLDSLPERISTIRKTDSVDTPENRFIKHALETFLKFCTDINKACSNRSKLYGESEI
jgi:predicted component of viral defense system (DUF524 family)